MNLYSSENLSQDTVHGYIPFTGYKDDVVERDIIDSPWVQRLRQIHQLQTAWFVYPTAEHTRFQHSIGTMHLAGRMLQQLYPSLKNVCGTLPSREYLESLVRMAGLLHDIGHGPFGHFFDARFLSPFGLNHEKIGSHIIRNELAPMLRQIRRNPLGQLADDEVLDPEQIAFLIERQSYLPQAPAWLRLLRSLFCGLYTCDNMDFVLRDALLTGFSPRAFDIDRLLHYSFFTPQGLTVHRKGFNSLIGFLTARAELFRNIYFHRTVRAIDLDLSELFKQSKDLLFAGNPLEHLDDYLHFTEFSLLVDVARWNKSDDARKRQLAPAWQNFLNRKISFHLAGETTALFGTEAHQQESTSIFGSNEAFHRAVSSLVSSSVPLTVDIARHLHRPDSAHRRESGLNYLYEPATDSVRRLEEQELYRHIPQSFRICRVYTRNPADIPVLAKALDKLVRGGAEDDETNM